MHTAWMLDLGVSTAWEVMDLGICSVCKFFTFQTHKDRDVFSSWANCCNQPHVQDILYASLENPKALITNLDLLSWMKNVSYVQTWDPSTSWSVGHLSSLIWEGGAGGAEVLGLFFTEIFQVNFCWWRQEMTYSSIHPKTVKHTPLKPKQIFMILSHVSRRPAYISYSRHKVFVCVPSEWNRELFEGWTVGLGGTLWPPWLPCSG